MHTQLIHAVPSSLLLTYVYLNLQPSSLNAYHTFNQIQTVNVQTAQPKFLPMKICIIDCLHLNNFEYYNLPVILYVNPFFGK